MSVNLTPEEKKDIEPLYKEYLRLIFGTDLSYSYNNSQIDLELLGGDLNLSGTKPGGRLKNVIKLVRDRVTTRLRTTIGETNLLPSNYGCNLDLLIGVNTMQDDSVKQSVSDFTKALITLTLSEEPLIENVNNVAVSIDNTSLNVEVNYKPILLTNGAATLEIEGE